VTDNAWDGRGLPPVAQARIARAAADGVRTSLLPTAGAVGLQSAGFEVVGEVLGTTVMQIGWTGFGGCGWYPGLGAGIFGPGTMTSGGHTRWRGYAPYVAALKTGRNTALDRLLQEATALGADGVVGVQLTESRIDGTKREFMALGTAVRSRGAERPGRPFTTDLSGQDVAKLLTAGWVPAGIAYGISVAIRHDDWRTRSQIGVFAGNTEVSGYTELITHVRADARARFRSRVAEIGADGAVASDLSLRVWEIEPSENHRDHVAESMVIGTAVARFHRGPTAPTRSLSILPLRPTSPDRRAR
jgi:uncharacterized protein YbjQ (UPF0145 family)